MDDALETLEILEVLHGDPMSLFSSSIRGMITASPGCELYMADYAAIEAVPKLGLQRGKKHFK